MKKVFLTSNMDFSYKINGETVSQPFNNENGIKERIKEKLEHEDLIIVFASNPNTFEKNAIYEKVIFESFSKSGFNFKEKLFIDNRYNGNLEEDIKRANLILLSGGYTPTQMEYFEKLDLRELLKNYEGVIIGMSAGSINLADLVVCSPEYEELETNYKTTWKGLGLTNINIEPHFILGELNEEKTLERVELLKLSEEYKIYAIVDGTDIYDDGVTQTMYGEGYLIENRKIKKICNKNENTKL